MTALDMTAADRVVVVTATAGYRHQSIETAESVIAGMSASMGLDLTFVRSEEEMRRALSVEALSGVKLLMFVNTTGEVAPSTRAAVLEWVAAGGSFAGFHSASDTWHSSSDYIEMLGAEFDRHPQELAVDLLVDDAGHPAMSGVTSPHRLFEEIYLFRRFDPGRVRMLMSIRRSPEDGRDGMFPIAWSRTHGKGRVFYTALGHRDDVWTSSWFQQQLRSAVSWSLRRDLQPRKRGVRRPF